MDDGLALKRHKYSTRDGQPWHKNEKISGNLEYICKMTVKLILIVTAFPVFRQVNLIEG